jgi:ammonia channel protein AmtB
MVTILAASMSAFTVYLLLDSFKRSENNHNVSISVSNGLLAGLVMITAVCDEVDPYSALVIGVMAGFTFLIGSNFLERNKIDDPIDAIPVHGFCGLIGAINVGIFSSTHGIIQVKDNYFR